MLGLPKFAATVDSEALDAKSPRFEGVTGAELPTNAPGGVGVRDSKFMKNSIVVESRTSYKT